MSSSEYLAYKVQGIKISQDLTSRKLKKLSPFGVHFIFLFSSNFHFTDCAQEEIPLLFPLYFWKFQMFPDLY